MLFMRDKLEKAVQYSKMLAEQKENSWQQDHRCCHAHREQDLGFLTGFTLTRIFPS